MKLDTDTLHPSTLRQHKGAQLTAQLLRRQWGLWCGVLLPGGDAVELGEGAGAPPAACLLLRGRQDHSGSCERSVRHWYQQCALGALPAGQVSQVGCHAGLRALLRPLHRRGQPVGALYASGFWPAALAQEGAQQLQQRAQALELGRLKEPGVVALDGQQVELISALLEELARALEAELVAQPVAPGAPRRRYQEIIGQSAPTLEMFALLDKVSASDSTVLIQGENGTGKELIARAVHFNSRRHNRAFVVQNCSALNDNLLDSELFGHKKGAFTGASVDKQGLFDLAHGGTFFLDEVGDMSPTLQVKMLRVLQEGTFLPVGGTVVRKVDVRIIAATNRDLKAMVAAGTFREDLFYRLNVINLVVPPLRQRRADIPLLVEHFLQRTSRRMHMRPGALEERAQALLMSYDWPGNVRELENEVERMVVLAGEGQPIDASLLSPRIRGQQARAATWEPDFQNPVPTGDLPGTLEALEKRMLLEGLRRTGWNKTRAAQQLGISRRNLIRKVERYQLEKLRDHSSSH